jgi:hypothetical protein
MMHTHRKFPALAAAVAVLVAVSLSACTTTMDQSVKLASQPVTPISVGDATTVSATELATAMLRAGFTKDEIRAQGPAVFDALATSGGAQVRQGKVVAALFAVHGTRMYVTSLTRGTFVVPLGVAHG